MTSEELNPTQVDGGGEAADNSQEPDAPFTWKWLLVPIVSAGTLVGAFLGREFHSRPDWFLSWFLPWKPCCCCICPPPAWVDQDLAWCVAHDASKYRMVVETSGSVFQDEVTLRVYDGTREVFAWKGDKAVPFVREGDMLYLAEHSPIATGCTVVAFDLAAGERVWETPLQGVGPVSHSEYFNTVTIEIWDGCITVRGMEAAGEYVEELDAETGVVKFHRIITRSPTARDPTSYVRD